MTYHLFGTLDWINAKLFRNRLVWPCWLLDWAWDKQATPGPAELDRIAVREKGRPVTTFRQYDDVAVVEHDPDTRQPKEGGRVLAAVVAAVDFNAVQVRYTDPAGHGGHPDVFWLSGWRVGERGPFRWRLVPLCRCERPILGEPVTDPDDPLRREFCRDECLTAEAEASCEQRYGPGVAT